MRTHFGWGATDYSWLLLAASLVGTAALASYSTAERLASPPATAALLAVGAAVGAAAFAIHTRRASSEVAHALLAVAMSGCLAALEPSLKALASRQLPQEVQGRSFGLMEVTTRLGDLCANLVGTRLYTLSMAAGGGGPGAAPPSAAPCAPCCPCLRSAVARCPSRSSPPLVAVVPPLQCLRLVAIPAAADAAAPLRVRRRPPPTGPADSPRLGAAGGGGVEAGCCRAAGRRAGLPERQRERRGGVGLVRLNDVSSLLREPSQRLAGLD